MQLMVSNLKLKNNVMNCSPLMKEVMGLVKQSDLDMTSIADKSGVSQQGLRNWVKGTDPRLSYVVAVLNTLGFDLGVMSMSENELRGRIEELEKQVKELADTVNELDELMTKFVVSQRTGDRTIP